MADVTAGMKTCALGDRRYGQQNGKDCLGHFDPQPTLYTTHGLRGKRTMR
jgi:hypothetical protein